MKKILIVLLVITGLAIGAGMYAWNQAKDTFNEVVNTVKGGEIGKPNMENWDKLKKGLSVEQAQELLGSSISYTVTVNDVATTYLIYTYSAGLLASPSDKSHNLEFDNDGKLVKWNEPKVAVVKATVSPTTK